MKVIFQEESYKKSLTFKCKTVLLHWIKFWTVDQMIDRIEC